MKTTKIVFGFIHNTANGFDVDLFAIDKLWLVNDKVDYAARLFRIPSPKWLQKLVFGVTA